MHLRIDPIWNPPTQQQIFRQLMQAMSFPGTPVDLAFIGPSSRTALAVLATLLDHTTTLCDLHQTLTAQDWRFLEARAAPSDQADYLLAQADRQPDARLLPKLGTLAGPDQSATLVLEGQVLGTGDLTLELSGPGIQGTRQVAVAGFARGWFERRATWVAYFPLGVDLVLVAGAHVLALPRTTQLQLSERSSTWAM